MWANDFRFSSHVSHFWTLLPIAKLAFSTLGLCQYTPSGVGTCPIIFVAIRFVSAPLMPVISAGGIRVVVVMSPPCILISVVHNAATMGATDRFLLGPSFAETVRKHESSRPPSGGARTVAGAASFAGEPVSAKSGLLREQAQQEKGEGEAP